MFRKIALLKNNVKFTGNICDKDLLELSCKSATLQKGASVWPFAIPKFSRIVFFESAEVLSEF